MTGKTNFTPGECYCRDLRYITSQVTRLYDQRLKEVGITCQQYSALVHIRSMEPVSVTELSRKMGLDRTSLSRNLKIMEKNYLIEDQEGAGRSRRIMLSGHGKKILAQAQIAWKRAQTDFEQLLSREQMEHLHELIDILSTNLSNYTA